MQTEANHDKETDGVDNAAPKMELRFPLKPMLETWTKEHYHSGFRLPQKTELDSPLNNTSLVRKQVTKETDLFNMSFPNFLYSPEQRKRLNK